MASYGGEDKKRKLDGSAAAPSSLRPEEIKDLLTALKQEQVVDLLVKACSAHPDVLDDVRDAASKDPATRKLFVRGLPWETTTEELTAAYEEFGDIDEAAVIVDKISGKSKGFGFVTFRHIDSAQKALRNPKKQIRDRTVHANLAALGSSATQRDNNDVSQRKVYVGGLNYDTTNETLLEVFGKFGEIEEGSIATERTTGKSRGFAFVTFRTAEGAQAACAEPVKHIDTRNVQVKLAAEGRQQRQQEQTSASGLQSYSNSGMGNQGYGGNFMGNRPMMNQPMGQMGFASAAPIGQMAGYANQGGLSGGQYGQMGAGQGFGAGQQFAAPLGQMGGMQGALQQPVQYANQAGFAAVPANAGTQQFAPQQGGQQGGQFTGAQQGFAAQQQFPAQMGGQVGAVQQPQGQFTSQAGNGQVAGGFSQQAVPGGQAAGMAGGLPNAMYSNFQGQ
ncbi:RNA binding domain protein [Klebsormidium nitens]|uniref:RNA binding domain protein n=1 Tax=Klebsormidium nitens TaxID=105231 RepID=A0A1Y1I415_KLENI|nr:RNA binding domain protein [Klebsormidium nitens]|eukprot:GAQ83487.1 RNA binding domain protein [Klebsormidium nitens]